MCRECFDAVNEVFPDESEDEKMDILWNFTAFPFGNPEQVRKQLLHLKDVGPVVVTQEFDEQYAKVAT